MHRWTWIAPPVDCALLGGALTLGAGRVQLSACAVALIGSVLASIGLTIPVVAFASIVLDLSLVLGLDPKDLVMLTLTFLVGIVTLGTGRTNVMQGAIHLVIFAAFLFLALVP